VTLAFGPSTFTSGLASGRGVSADKASSRKSRASVAAHAQTLAPTLDQQRLAVHAADKALGALKYSARNIRNRLVRNDRRYTVRPEGLVCRMNRETLLIQGWGQGLRVRATLARDFRDDALSALTPRPDANPLVKVDGPNASVTQGGLRCEVTLVYPHGEPREEAASALRRRDDRPRAAVRAAQPLRVAGAARLHRERPRKLARRDDIQGGA